MTGNFSRMPGSLMVLAERMGNLHSLLSPTNLGIVAIGVGVIGMAAAIAHGHEEMVAMNNALAVTSNYAGMTRASIDALAETMTRTKEVTIGHAKQIVTELVASGRIGQQSIAQVAQLASDFAKATGRDIEKITPELIKLFSDPAKGAEELNKSMHFLTVTDQEHIVTLERLGRTQEAQQVLAEKLTQHMPKQAENVALLERSWRGWAGAIAEVVDSIGKLGKTDTTADLLKKNQHLIEVLEAGNTWGVNDKQIERLKQANMALMDKYKAEQQDVKASADAAAANQLQAQSWDAVKKASQLYHAQELQDQMKLIQQLKPETADQAAAKLDAERRVAKEIQDLYRSMGAEGRQLAQQRAASEEQLEQIRIKSEEDQIKTELDLGKITKEQFDLKMVNVKLEENAAKQEYEHQVLRIGGLSKVEEQAHKLRLNQLQEEWNFIEQAGVNKQAVKEKEAYDEIVKAVIDTGNAELKRLNDAIRAQKEHNAEIGLTAEGKAAVKRAIEDETAAQLQSDAAFLQSLLDEQQFDEKSRAVYEMRLKLLQDEIAKRRELAGLMGQASVLEAEAKTAAEAKKLATDVGNSLSDAIVNGGEHSAQRLRSIFGRLVLNPIVQPIGAALGSMVSNVVYGSNGMSTIGTLGSAGSNLYSAAAGMTSMGNTAAQLYQYGSTALAGGTAAVSTGAAGTGWVSAEGGASYLSTGASSVGSAFSTAVPYLAAAYAIYSIAKSLDHSGTYHTGALAEYSAAGGLLTGSNGTHAGPRAGDTNYGTGFGGVDFSQQTADFVGGISKSIVGILDSTAATFGKTAGYTAATAFADDTSKDGAWGALLISKLGEKIVDWQDARNSSWAPREFGDGEAGRTQYLAELSKSVRTALDDIGLPGWAQSMLDSLGDAPALTDLAAVVDKVNAIQHALVGMGDVIAGFSNLSDDATSALIAASGGADSFISGMNAFYNDYTNEAEKVANLSSQVSAALAAVGLEMPTTRDGLRALFEAQLSLGEAGAPAVAAILRVQGAFGTVADYSKQMADQAIADAQRRADESNRLAQEEQRIASQRTDLELRLMELSGDAAGALAIQRQRELAAMDDALQPLQQRINALEDLANAEQSALSTFQDFMSGINSTLDSSRSALQASWDDLKRRAGAGDAARQVLQQAYDRESAENARRIATADTARQALDAAYKEQADVFQKTIDQFDTFAKSLADFRTQLAVGDLSPLSPEQKYLRSKEEFERVAAAARAGDVDAIGRLQGAISTFRSASMRYNASSAGFVSDAAATDAVLQEVQSFAKSKADDGRTQLEALNQQVVGLLTASNSSALSVADAIANLRSALPDAEAAQQRQATIDQEVAGLLVAANNSALSVEDAIANLQSVLPDAEEAQRELTLRQSEVEALLGLTTGVGDLQTTIDNFRNAQTAVTTANSNQSAIGSMYQDILGHGADSAGLASWMNVLNHGGTLDQVRAGIQNSPEKAIQDLYRSILGRAGSADEVHAWQMRSLGGTSIDDIRNAFLNSDEYLRNHSHMDGGVASGWSLVGEEGPELINFTNPARVYTASQTRAALSDGESDQAARETSAAIRRNTEVVERQNELLEQLVLEVRTGTESGHIDIRDLKQHLSYVVSKVAA
ncbi:phage tail length tape measure family protein [Herbaspirillum sp. ST 5-3]|uniref:phage tail length tape measure family protein n=1 Tax=Oxalobacteraceae TaxID=75682 RepID=UPI0020002442|nr:phage tail length tape measure family protein [Herbaspirillum sp. ST 5-3]